jgi:cyclic beta-1,2-glucan synthetase
VMSYTADRREFLGRNGTPASPAAVQRSGLSGTVGLTIDPCGVLQFPVTLAPGETKEIVMLLGAGATEAGAMEILKRLRANGAASGALDRAVTRWKQRLTTISVKTPEPTLDLMVNRWSLYQALSCRMWARSALYQSSGAFGFRDQLQDVMAFVYSDPELARAHIIRAAGRQFTEGDVQHWWHPQSGRGVRTRFSDDLAWLPYVISHYIETTGDAAILDEQAQYITMRQLAPDEHEIYDLPQASDESGSIYGHCLRALKKACTKGAHGLPLIGSGDWNDGFSRVGIEGKGESVWLAWFLITTLRGFAKLSSSRGDTQTRDWVLARANEYKKAVEENAWDGAWYRRAYFDDGSPLGSSTSDECKIDSIAQSWSIISRAGDSSRVKTAMKSFEEHLVREDARLLLLLNPPFDKTTHDPGYIQGYLPGVRENGAQYTHASLWSVLATALLGEGNRAMEMMQMINPVTHSGSPEAVQRYKVEPYVVAADVYSAEGHIGRGGWTWYTGSASWAYRVALETILGFQKRGNSLQIDPCIPSDWKEFSISYRFGKTIYAITIKNPDGIQKGQTKLSLDDRVLDGALPLADDGGEHEVIATLSASPARSDGEGKSPDR